MREKDRNIQANKAFIEKGETERKMKEAHRSRWLAERDRKFKRAPASRRKVDGGSILTYGFCGGLMRRSAS